MQRIWLRDQCRQWATNACDTRLTLQHSRSALCTPTEALPLCRGSLRSILEFCRTLRACSLLPQEVSLQYLDLLAPKESKTIVGLLRQKRLPVAQLDQVPGRPLPAAVHATVCNHRLVRCWGEARRHCRSPLEVSVIGGAARGRRWRSRQVLDAGHAASMARRSHPPLVSFLLRPRLPVSHLPFVHSGLRQAP